MGLVDSDYESYYDMDMLGQEDEQDLDLAYCELPFTDMDTLVEDFERDHILVVDSNQPHAQLPSQPPFLLPESSQADTATRCPDSEHGPFPFGTSDFTPAPTSRVSSTNIPNENDIATISNASESSDDVDVESLVSASLTPSISSSSNSSTGLGPFGHTGGPLLLAQPHGLADRNNGISTPVPSPLVMPGSPPVTGSFDACNTTFPSRAQANCEFTAPTDMNHSIQDQGQNQSQGMGRLQQADRSIFLWREHSNGETFLHPYARVASSACQHPAHPLSPPVYNEQLHLSTWDELKLAHRDSAMEDIQVQSDAAVSDGYAGYEGYSGAGDDTRSDVGFAGRVDGQAGMNAAGLAESTIHLGLLFGNARAKVSAGDMNTNMNGQLDTKPATSTITSASLTPSQSPSGSPPCDPDVFLNEDPGFPSQIIADVLASPLSSNKDSDPTHKRPESPTTSFSPSVSSLLSRPFKHPESPTTSFSPSLLSRPFNCPTPDCIKSFTKVDKFTYHILHGPCPFVPPPETYKSSNKSVDQFQHPSEYGDIGKEDGTGQTSSTPMPLAFLDVNIIEVLLQAEEDVLQNLVDVVQLAIVRNDFRESGMLDRFLRATAGKRGILPSSIFLSGVSRIGSNSVQGGGFADIWMGEYEGRSVALKVLRIFNSKDREKMQLEFSKEALLWRKLDHPNILPFLGICRDAFAPRMALVSHWMKNGNLEGFLKQNRWADRHKLAVGVARGLEYLHNLKPRIIHGDLRAANVLIDEDNKPRITDFGLSRAFNSQGTMTASSFNGKGTLRWQAPELLNATRFGEEMSIPTTKSDVYAFSCLCLEVFTGKAPFAGLHDGNVILEVAVHDNRPQRPEDRADLDDEVWSIMQLCWKTQPSDRPEMSFVVSSLEILDRHDATYILDHVACHTILWHCNNI